MAAGARDVGFEVFAAGEDDAGVAVIGIEPLLVRE